MQGLCLFEGYFVAPSQYQAMSWNTSLISLLTALGIGLLIGTVRERLHQPGVVKAGVRTHAIVALLGTVSYSMDVSIFIAVLLVTGFMIAIGYRQSAPEDPGMTGEFTLLLTLVLSGLAVSNASLSAAMGVVVACLLFVKKPLRKFSQEVLTEKELEDALMLCASVLVVLPLLPTDAIDRWNVLKPYSMWKIVVLIMGVGMLGHIFMRASGMRWGLPLAGFFTGLISSTAAVAEFGRHAKEKPEHVGLASTAAMLAVLSSLMLFVLVLGTSSPKLLYAAKVPLLTMATSLAATGFYHLRHADITQVFGLPASRHAFKTSHALLIALTISAVTLCSAWLRELFGDSGALATAIIVAFVEIHAAAVSMSQLSQADSMELQQSTWGVLAILASSMTSKIFLAYLSGGKNYGHKIAIGLSLAMTASVISMVLFNISPASIS